MKEYLKTALVIILAAIVVMGVSFLLFFHSLGTDFVHKSLSNTIGDTATQKSIYANDTPVVFQVNYTRNDFELVLDSFIEKTEQYRLPDSIKLPTDVECGCICSDWDRMIYFKKGPEEVYEITTQNPEIKQAVVDVIFKRERGVWSCSKTTFLDSAEKDRIRERVETEIIKNIK